MYKKVVKSSFSRKKSRAKLFPKTLVMIGFWADENYKSLIAKNF